MTNARNKEIASNIRGAIADIKMNANWCEVLVEDVLTDLNKNGSSQILNLHAPANQKEWDQLYPTVLAHEEATLSLAGMCKMLYQDIGDIWGDAEQGLLISYKNEWDDYRFPAWQFGPDRRLLPGLAEVLEKLTKQGMHDKAAMEYFLQGEPGKRPLDKLRRRKKVRIRNVNQ